MHKLVLVEDRNIDISEMNSVVVDHDGILRSDADARQCTSNDNRDVYDNDTDVATSSQTSWLYQCMISKCSASFDRLLDFRMHFVDSHQPDQMAVPCCFCMKEFPTWSSVVTSHIASHVKVKSIRCVECSLSFATKETLMCHVHGCHSRLPKGICIDVSIENHERRYLQCKSDLLSDSNSALLSSKVPDTEEQRDYSTKIRDSRNVNYADESTTCDSGVTQSDDMKTALERCSPSDIDDVELSISDISSEKSVSPVSHAGNTVRGSSDLSLTKTSRRKSRKASHVVDDDGGFSETVCTSDCSWVEIVAATQQMTVHCRQCTFTCNTQMQRKVHVYECHDKPRGTRPVTPMSVFTCKHCGASASTLATHRSHLAHHLSPVPDLLRIFHCVYCDSRSDNIEVLEQHVARHHPTEDMKFEVQQSNVSYLQGMMMCPVCFGAFTWKDDLLRHFGAVHHLEELVAHLESEFTSETCPPCCRVPWTLFKSLLREPTGSLPSSKKSSEGTNTDGGGGVKKIDSGSSPRHKLSNSRAKSIQRYHCDLCEFSANDVQQLEQHSSEQHSSRHGLHERPAPPTPDKLPSPVTETSSTIPHRKQTSDKHFCDLCPFSTLYTHCLKHHLNLHKNSASVKVGYKCAYCNMAFTYRSSIRLHQNFSHRGRPIKALRIKDGKVVKDSSNSDSVSTAVKAKSPSAHGQPIKVLRIKDGKVVKESSNSTAVKLKSPSAVSSSSIAKKQIKLKLSKSKVIAERPTSPRTSPTKTVTTKQTASASSVNTAELVGSEKETSTEELESKLPKEMIYGEPVCCPLCDFSSCARPNLLRHIRLTHANDQLPKTRLGKSCRPVVRVINCANVDPTSLLHMEHALPELVLKTDTVGVFVPSVPQSSVEHCLDAQYSSDISQLAASISHYPQMVRGAATSMSNLVAGTELLDGEGDKQENSVDHSLSELEIRLISARSASDADEVEMDITNTNASDNASEDLESRLKAVDGRKTTSTPVHRYYQCRYCDYHNMNPLLVRNHVMTNHLNYRPFSCQSCDYTAIRGSYVTHHVRAKHRGVPCEKCNYFCSRDEMMESKLKNGYYLVSFSKSDVDKLSVKLQDHTYNSIPSVADTNSASNLSKNPNDLQSRHATSTDSSPDKVSISPQKKKKFRDSAFYDGNLYKCLHCEYSADNRRSVNMHASKKHRNLLQDKSCDDLPPEDSSDIDVVGPAAGNDDCLNISADFDYSLFTAAEMQESSSKAADTSVFASQLGACEEVNDIIYCCETCPCSFPTPEALSSHKCGLSVQQAVT